MRRITRFLISIVLFIFFVVPVAKTQAIAALTGVYNGKYTCVQGTTNLKLSLTASPAGDISGLFTFYLPPGTRQQGYTYSLHGQYDPHTAKLSLSPVRWETPPPPTFLMVGMNGTFSSTEFAGTITAAGCTSFNVERSQAESAKIAAVMAAQKSVAPPAAAAAAAHPSQTAIIKYLCFSTDPKQPVYFSDVFDLPDPGDEAENFMDYVLAKEDFQLYLVDKYKYPDTEDLADCSYMSVAATNNVTGAMAAKKQSMAAQAVAAKKQVIETGWKDTP